MAEPTATSFVFEVEGFDDYEAAIAAKIRRTVIDTGGGGEAVIPIPATLPLLLGAVGCFGIFRRRRST